TSCGATLLPVGAGGLDVWEQPAASTAASARTTRDLKMYVMPLTCPLRASLSSNRRACGSTASTAEAQLVLAGHCVGNDGVTVREMAIQELERERVLHQPLNGALEWSRAERRIVTLLGNQVSRGGRQLQCDAPVGKQLLDA